MITKKLISGTTLLLVISLLLASCSQDTIPDDTGSTAPDTTPQPETNDLVKELGTHDLGGRSFVILDACDYPGINVNLPAESENGDLINDGLFRRDRKIEEALNCSIEYVQISDGTAGTDALRDSVLAGDQDYNLCIATISGGRLSTLAAEGLLANLCDMPYLGMDQNWWSRLMYENCQINEKMYFTTGDISPVMYKSPYAVYINQMLLEKYSIDVDIFGLVREGNWTIDRLNEITKPYENDLNGDGTMHINYDFFGLVHQLEPNNSSMMLAAVGIPLTSFDKGKLSLSLTTEKVINAVEKLRDMTVNLQYDNTNDVSRIAFQHDRAIAMMYYVGYGLRNMESDYTVVPMPKYDENQANYYCEVNGWCDSFVGIPMNVDADFTGLVAEALARESYQTLRPVVVDLVLKAKGSRSEESVEMLDYIYNNTYVDLGYIYNFGGITDVMANVIFNDAPLVSSVEAVSSSAKAAMDDLTNAWTQED